MFNPLLILVSAMARRQHRNHFSLSPYAAVLSLEYRSLRGARERCERNERNGIPFSFDFGLTDGILRCRLVGRITDDVLKEFFRMGAQHAIRTRPSAGVVDLTEVSSFEVSSPVIERLAKSPPVLPDPKLRRVIIAPSPEMYGMMRMFEIEGEHTRPGIHVVHTQQEAWDFLSVEEPRFDRLDIM